MDRILIIDDDVALCELVTEYLGPLGFEIESVHRGDTGTELAIGGKHSIIVLDVMLPGLNGRSADYADSKDRSPLKSA